MNATHSRLQRIASTALLVPVIVVLSAFTPVLAQTKTTVHYKEVHYQFSNNAVLVGSPEDGHIKGVWARRGLTIFDNGEVAPYSALGDFDITKGSGTISGTDTTFFADGSSWSTKFKGQFSIGSNGLWVIPHEGEFIKGTGRFEGISGTLVYTSKQVDKRPDFEGFAVTEGSATYSVPQK